MGRSSYDRLTALDYSFLALEKPNAYMHVASTQIYEAGPLRLEDGGDLVPDLHAFVECVTASFEDLRRVAGVEAKTG